MKYTIEQIWEMLSYASFDKFYKGKFEDYIMGGPDAPSFEEVKRELEILLGDK